MVLVLTRLRGGYRLFSGLLYRLSSACPAVELCTKRNRLFFCKTNKKLLGTFGAFQDNAVVLFPEEVSLDCYCHSLFFNGFIAQAPTSAGRTLYMVRFHSIGIKNIFYQ